MSTEVRAMFGAIQSLDATQLAAAKLDGSFDDVLVGPGEDGNFPTREGVLVSDLDLRQRQLVVYAIRQWVGDVEPAVADAAVRRYRRQFERTRMAWATSTDPNVQGAYVRLHGPRLWIEFVVQGAIVVEGIHYHTIHRDAVTDYGAE